MTSRSHLYVVALSCDFDLLCESRLVCFALAAAGVVLEVRVVGVVGAMGGWFGWLGLVGLVW